MQEVPDKDAARVQELIKGIERMKVKSPKAVSVAADTDSLLAQDLREAGQELASIKRGETVSHPARKLLAELKHGLQGRKYPVFRPAATSAG